MEELIKKVQENPILYNMNNADYQKANLKKRVWDKIAQELNYKNGDEPRNLWKRLRTSHRDALRRKEERIQNGCPESECKPWKYESHMKFLLQYMIGRHPNAEKAIEHTNTIIKSEIDIEIEETDLQTRNFRHIQENTTNSYSSEYDGVEEMNQWEKPLQATVKIENIHPEMLNDENFATETPITRQDTTTESDELYNFYMSMYNVTKSLPLIRQIKLKRIIFNAVTVEQEQELFCSGAKNKQDFVTK